MAAVDAELLGSLLARLETLEAKEAIRDVMYRYARGADRADLELFKSCYWPDATDCHWFWNGNAHAFADYVIPLLREIPNSQHSITNPIIELDGELLTACESHHARYRRGTRGDALTRPIASTSRSR